MNLLLQGFLLSTLTVSVAMANDNFSTPRRLTENTTSETVKVEATAKATAAKATAAKANSKSTAAKSKPRESTAKSKPVAQVDAAQSANFAVRKLTFSDSDSKN